MPITWGLDLLDRAFNGVPVLQTIGAFGLAVIILTIIIRGVLSPLYHFQIAQSRKTMQQQRKLGPELAGLKKRYKGDQQKLTQETMKLYKEQGVNPLGQLSGCLPALLQMPILIALYYAFRGAASSSYFGSHPHFLFIPNLNVLPSTSVLIHGLPIPTIPYLVVPILAAATTFVQSKMMQQAPNPLATEQEQQQQQMMKTMLLLMPLMIFYFAVVTPAALGLYWFVSN
ncbi:MAG: YidC/Oxa1 family membrane protein insertase, partial [Candidatus Dormibacteraceae bacterium]